jgi:hypothetical protein
MSSLHKCQYCGKFVSNTHTISNCRKLSEQYTFWNGQWVATPYCMRCGHESHEARDCVAQYHLDGSKLPPRQSRLCEECNVL